MKVAGACINMEAYREDRHMQSAYKAVFPKVGPHLAASIAADGSGVLTGGEGKMFLTLSFTSVQEAVGVLNASGRQHIKVLNAAEYWDIAEGDIEISAEKHVFLATPKTVQLHSATPKEQAGADCVYEVSYYAAYIDGKKLWEVSPENMICTIGGVDYLADIRQKLRE